jgi:hypothetical protein
MVSLAPVSSRTAFRAPEWFREATAASECAVSLQKLNPKHGVQFDTTS